MLKLFAYSKCVNLFKKHALRMSVFTQKLNPLTGENDWIIQNEDYDYHQEVARSSFADMLHDTERNVKYEAALKIAIERMHANGKNANVLDIGTGTGLLSMMAVRNGADTVVACEAFKPMSECALNVIKLNGFDDKIKLIQKRSTDITVGINCDMESRANILITEVFDTELIGEGALGTFKHAHDCLIEKDSITIPQSGTIYAQIIESPYLFNWNGLKDVFSDDGELIVKIPESVWKCSGTASVHDIQLSQLDLSYVKTIVSPQSVFRFDWSGNTPFVYERSTINTLKAVCDGNAQGVFVWWDLKMDVDNQVTLSCAPYWSHPDYNDDKDGIPWRDHWMQAVYYFPKEISVKQGEEINLISCHDEYSLWFNLKKDLRLTDAHYLPPLCNCGLHIAYARTRIGQMNDFKRVKKILNAIEGNVNEESVVLALGNGFVVSLAAIKYGATKLLIVDNNHSTMNIMKTIVEYNNFENVEIYEKIEDIANLSNVNCILAEPYFVNSILPWDNLMFIYLLQNTELLNRDDIKVIPKTVSIKCIPVAFKDLHKIRAPLGDCERFRMEPFDQLIEVINSNIDLIRISEFNYRLLFCFWF